MTRIFAGLVAALVVAGCSSIPSPSLASPTLLASHSPATPTPGASASGPTPSPAPGALAVDCGPLGDVIDFATCFNAVATAATALGADLPTNITVLSGEPSAPQPTATTDLIGSTTVTVETLRLQAYRVHFGYRGGGFTEIPVYLGADAVWGLGLTPSDGRRYSIGGDLAAWTDPGPFVLEAFTYQVDGECSGSGGRKAVGTMILERVAPSGSITEAYRVTCGPAELGASFGGRVDLAQGTYRVRFEGVIVGLSGMVGAVGVSR